MVKFRVYRQKLEGDTEEFYVISLKSIGSLPIPASAWPEIRKRVDALVESSLWGNLGIEDEYHCKRCGYKWRPRVGSLPKRCPSCQSRYWSTERQ